MFERQGKKTQRPEAERRKSLFPELKNLFVIHSLPYSQSLGT
jgi:hypothetical protein